MSTDRPGWTPELLKAPHGAPNKAQRLRRMFNGIAPRYELINWLFSAGRDAVWRREAVKLAAVSEDDEVLDVACGTGDFARAFAWAGAGKVVGCDFAHEMLVRAVGYNSPATVHGLELARRLGRPDTARVGARRSLWCEADALRLPFRSGSFSVVSCAFGVRNFEDLDAGLAEMHRVLRSRGKLVILEFSRPKNRLTRTLYECYANHLMPLAATFISGDRWGAYRYLPRSVVSFPDVEQLIARLRAAGFASVRCTTMTMGIVTVYVALRD